ncbi:MAG: isoprenyl transferase [Paludibacter sp.]|nr:isoprenyl transferase [Paludibacter sp.]MDD4198139.1 isoprenyl transferase [Paludibacter sp.]MDD4427365.1 isoprenyl transferase [Paludibacter sp.]
MSTYKDKIDLSRLPQHIAIIMDGNGRWAKEKGYPRVFGHKNGVKSVSVITEAATELGIRYLTLYVFSTENWGRPREEVNALMELLVDSIEKETARLQKNNIRLLTIGDTNRLPEKVRAKLTECTRLTTNNTGLCLILALSYSSRWEIKNAIQHIAEDAKKGKINPEDISDELISSYMLTKNIPDPDLLIRTSGEIRISNFLLWQIAYAELYFTEKHWPAFRKEEFYKSIVNYQKRDRRFGK